MRKKFIKPFFLLSATMPRKGPVKAINKPQTPVVHCQQAAPNCTSPTICLAKQVENINVIMMAENEELAKSYIP